MYLLAFFRLKINKWSSRNITFFYFYISFWYVLANMLFFSSGLLQNHDNPSAKIEAVNKYVVTYHANQGVNLS